MAGLEKICAFCTRSAIRDRCIAENKHAWMFLTNMPIVPGHVLIVSRRCVAYFKALTSEEQHDIFELLYRVQSALAAAFGSEGFNIAWNEGEAAGQSVPHFHLHVVPRKSGDTGITKYEPRKFLYRPGSRAQTPQEELLVVTQHIQAHW